MPSSLMSLEHSCRLLSLAPSAMSAASAHAPASPSLHSEQPQATNHRCNKRICQCVKSAPHGMLGNMRVHSGQDRHQVAGATRRHASSLSCDNVLLSCMLMQDAPMSANRCRTARRTTCYIRRLCATIALPEFGRSYMLPALLHAPIVL